MQLDLIDIVKTKYLDRFIIYRNDSIIGDSLSRYGEYQQIELDFLSQFIRPSSVVYDIGSNIGYHATAFSNISHNVYCFEANPDHYQLLKLNLKDNNHCRLHNLAVGKENGTILVEDFDANTPDNYGAVRVGASTGRPVQMAAIDTLELPPANLMKIDVEGHELAVLQGAAKMIKKHNPFIYFEAAETQDFPDIYNMLTSLSYKLYWTVIMNYNPDNYNKNSENVFASGAVCSVLAIPNSANMQCGLSMVKDETDTWQKHLARHKK